MVKFHNIMAMVMFEKTEGRPSRFLKMPELTSEEKKNMKDECNAAIDKLRHVISLNHGATVSVYENQIDIYKKMIAKIS